MKTSLRKLGRFALHRHVDSTERRYLRSLSKLDEFSQASQDLDNMRDCYDSLLSAAAATTNSAYEFSESLRELGSCLFEKTSVNEDEESRKVLLMLGKVQLEIHKLLDRYRSHVSQTITVPSQSLLNELQTVEEMKRQCDEKRSLYQYMAVNHRENGRSRTGKGENFSVQQVQDAREQYDEEATLFIFRLKSLKQGQSRSLLTQAVRHHAAQLHLFRKSLRCLEAPEPHVKLIAEEQHIDYHLNGLEDDDDVYAENEDEVASADADCHYRNKYISRNNGELSFDYNRADHPQVDKPTQRHLMEENLETNPREISAINEDIKMYSQSAPLLAEKRSSDLSDLMLLMRQSSVRKLQTYVLPTPEDPKSPVSRKPFDTSTFTSKTSLNRHNQMVWHSSPLEPQKHGKKSADDKHFGGLGSSTLPFLKDSSRKSNSSNLPPPLAEGFLFSQFDPGTTPSSRKFERQAYSGPLAKKPESSQSLPEHPQPSSGPIQRNPISQPLPSSPKASSISSSPLTSSPKINELHELPRPPVSSTGISGRPFGAGGYSPLLVSRGPQNTSVKSESMAAGAASPLPRPPPVVSRSFSIPTSVGKVMISQCLQVPPNVEMPEGVSSPVSASLSLLNIRPKQID
ncbi:hypothetical protein SAY87_001753 [Trapa incisa]|uniref:Hydroxyproline-rich glycoprotein family protein n=1 Tax=Trapa incisa TaxID=236973 RepID=A0AAN7PTP9_9MYRT|nr:hypothetical protein SAY87_001753 [Trapa incisa]